MKKIKKTIFKSLISIVNNKNRFKMMKNHKKKVRRKRKSKMNKKTANLIKIPIKSRKIKNWSFRSRLIHVSDFFIDDHLFISLVSIDKWPKISPYWWSPWNCSITSLFDKIAILIHGWIKKVISCHISFSVMGWHWSIYIISIAKCYRFSHRWITTRLASKILQMMWFIGFDIFWWRIYWIIALDVNLGSRFNAFLELIYLCTNIHLRCELRVFKINDCILNSFYYTLFEFILVINESRLDLFIFSYLFPDIRN